MANVAFEHVQKMFGTVEAVKDLTLTVQDSEFLVLVGPSGSGKTTALRMLAGLESITSGRILIDGRPVNDIRPQDRNIAMVFQDYALYPQMTVSQNLAFGLRMRRMPRDQIAAQVQSTAERLEIEHLLGRKPGELSGGQRQRVALGRALARDPKVFLMDEPLSNLDAKLRVQTRGEIKALQKDLGTTTVFVTHDQVEAMTMGDRIAVMNNGGLEQLGDPDSVYQKPANVFVAGFIGSPAMTFLRASVGIEEARPVLRLGALDLPLSRPPERLPAEVIVGIRPEYARLWGSSEGLVGPLRGEVLFTEALGRETFVGIRTAEGSLVTVQAGGQYRTHVGETVEIGLDERHLHLFDVTTEAAIERVADM